MSIYLIIHVGEDGPSMAVLNEKDLLERITPSSIGGTYYGQGPLQFTAHPPDLGEAQPGTVFIFKGTPVIPKVREAVVSYELP
jgi:hypothetical protein